MMRQIKHKNTVNVFAFLKHIRQQRNYLVQTEEQYIFTHDALLEYIQCGETEVRSSYMTAYLHSIMQADEKTGETILGQQYQ
ncbi:PREDICTED: receptor-type tyrosine-protein phosphatase gamma-like, partial [Priapulus caudatus]